MKNKEKTYSIALASTFMVLFLIFASSTASASIGEDLHKAPPDITSGAGDSSNDKVLSDEFSIEGKSTATESVQPASLKITEKRITTDEADSSYPAIYGNTIVWEDCRSEDSNWDIGSVAKIILLPF